MCKMASHIRQWFKVKNSLCKLPSSVKLNRIHNSNVPGQGSAGTHSDMTFANREREIQNEEFTAEKRRQIESIGRIEKIVVNVSGPPQDAILYMNKNISTPYDCGRHTTESVIERAALALVDSKDLWDMHRPLPANCKLKFLYFDDDDPKEANDVFWESCCFILGAVISNAFQDSVKIMLHSYPPPDYKTGSFVYDAQLSLENWIPSANELRVLTAEMMKICNSGYNFERLDVSKDLALALFEGNPYKEKQIEEVASNSQDNSVTLYRIGRHIDLCKGPLMANTNLVNICTVSAVHQIQTVAGLFYRFQGVALPKPLVRDQLEIMKRIFYFYWKEVPKIDLAVHTLQFHT